MLADGGICIESQVSEKIPLMLEASAFKATLPTEADFSSERGGCGGRVRGLQMLTSAEGVAQHFLGVHRGGVRRSLVGW